MQQLLNKKALVTGAIGGIGEAIVRQLANDGAEIVIHHLNDADVAEKLSGELAAQGVKTHVLQADLADRNQVLRLANEAWNAMSGIDFLINNAGVSYKKHFLDITEEDVNHFTDINFKGTLWLTQAVARQMINAGIEGSIYTITSINAMQPGVGLSTYGATKAALETLMKGIALELAPHNIKVNTIAPGGIATAMNAAVWQDEQRLKSVNEHIPLGRLGMPEEIAKVLCGLLATGSYITGATIPIDGGWTLQQGFVKPSRYDDKQTDK